MKSLARSVGLLTAALLIASACGSGSPTGTASSSTNSSKPPSHMRSDIAILCTEPAVLAGHEPQSGARLCGKAVLGDRLASVDFSRDLKLPKGILAVFSNQPVTQEDAAISGIEGGAATITVAKSTPEAALALSTQAKDAAVIIDFGRPAAGSSVGIAVRCSADECAMLRLDSDGKYWLAERDKSGTAHVVTSGDLNADLDYPAPRLNVAEPNRLVVWVKANEVGAELNGRLLAQETIQASSEGNVYFFLRSIDPSQAAEIHVLRAYFYDVG